MQSGKSPSTHFHNSLSQIIVRCEGARHCRWVDEVIPDAPWIIDADFMEKWQIDYVAHDEDPYGAVGHDDVYTYVKSQGEHTFTIQPIICRK